MKHRKKIACLPVAGIENPYQLLMMKGLSEGEEYSICHGSDGKLFAILRTALFFRPHIIHFDWIHSYYLRKKHWMTIIQFSLFIIEITLVKYILGIKLVWTLHNILPHDRPYWGPYKWARLFFAKQVEKIRVFNKNTIYKASKQFNISKEKFWVCPEGSYVDFYPNDVSKLAARNKHNINKEVRIWLYLGTIRPYKGLDILIESFKGLELNNTKLIIVGKALDPVFLAQIQSNKNQSIQIIEGFIPKNELQTYFNAADLVILPFKEVENSGSAILAMGFKKPIVAPRIGVLRERLSQQSQLLYEQGNLKGMLQMASQMTDKELEAIGKVNFEALKNYKWQDFKAFFMDIK